MGFLAQMIRNKQFFALLEISWAKSHIEKSSTGHPSSIRDLSLQTGLVSKRVLPPF